MNEGVNIDPHTASTASRITRPLRINKYMPVVVLYFFLNGFLLPHGLLYTTLLTPFFLVWLFRFPEFRLLPLFFLFILPFVIANLVNGIDTIYYIRSFLLLLAIYIFTLSVYRFLRECRSLRIIYRNLLVINIFFVGIALVALLVPAWTSRFWYTNDITLGVKNLKRLQMLTYEPSYYSTLFVPLALYYYLKAIVLKLPNRLTTLLLLSIPLLLSLSFGIILGLALSLSLTLLAGFRSFFPGEKLPAYFLAAGAGLILLFLAGWALFPENLFYLRISNVFTGQDSSFRGRTFDSFYLGWKIAAVKSIWFGCGPGQVKIIGLGFFNEYYHTTAFTVDQVGIPNSIGDTLATFGLLGVALRLGLEIWLFFRTRVTGNYYRLSLFLFIFIYQFTGSFLTNIAEYAIWAMAFNRGLFEEFDRIRFQPRILPRAAVSQ